MDDRRLFARIDAEFPVRFLDPLGGEEGEAKTLNISANGVGLVSEKKLVNKTPLEIWLNIPDQHTPLYTRGEVVWNQALVDTEQYQVGVRLDSAELMGLARALWVKKRM